MRCDRWVNKGIAEENLLRVWVVSPVNIDRDTWAGPGLGFQASSRARLVISDSEHSHFQNMRISMWQAREGDKTER